MVCVFVSLICVVPWNPTGPLKESGSLNLIPKRINLTRSTAKNADKYRSLQQYAVLRCTRVVSVHRCVCLCVCVGVRVYVCVYVA